MPTLDDFPKNRRYALMWHYVLFPGLTALEKSVRKPGRDHCTEARLTLPNLTAAHADDGMVHLMRGDQLLCQAAPGARAASHVTPGHEPDQIRPLTPAADPGQVPEDQRCTAGMDYTEKMHSWPRPPTKTASIRPLRAALVDALGPDCHLCGRYPGAMVDHDHGTGLVRGLLCALCNRTADCCVHLSEGGL
ncbi:hypothetical protein P3T36_007251 [Kitasatospora sp. MAP12-15]|uniref:endonuclease domain-containing protein n=1 Tax=unclassified Kitasatospora TaxID=2633591 RepID=UPI0024766491|nr:endonuclease domain-containing protein [Kitasatospora sp. MAP12-44]MDH6115634.1 hypothetical protein [Kitasatospora sp. MAP12-44]